MGRNTIYMSTLFYVIKNCACKNSSHQMIILIELGMF
jgi:hypothetical protein